jgi:hypothetical protein
MDRPSRNIWHLVPLAGDMTAKDESAQRSSAAATSSSLINPAATIPVHTRSIVSVRKSVSGIPPRSTRPRAHHRHQPDPAHGTAPERRRPNTGAKPAEAINSCTATKTQTSGSR